MHITITAMHRHGNRLTPKATARETGVISHQADTAQHQAAIPQTMIMREEKLAITSKNHACLQSFAHCAAWPSACMISLSSHCIVSACATHPHKQALRATCMPQGMKVCCCRWVHPAPDAPSKNLQDTPCNAASHLPVILWQGPSSQDAHDMHNKAENTVLFLLL
jgi:hypothetical protein